MSNILKYKGYQTKIEFDSEKLILFDKIENISDSVIFESKDVKEIVNEFHNAVDEYLVYCENASEVPDKGAIFANEGEEVLIPLNMRDGSLLCIGKGNPEWNYSAPHGAGRLISRSKSKELITLDEFVKSMKGIYSTSINESTIDESPMVYKDSKEIELLISDSVEVKEYLLPVYNFKAGSKE